MQAHVTAEGWRGRLPELERCSGRKRLNSEPTESGEHEGIAGRRRSGSWEHKSQKGRANVPRRVFDKALRNRAFRKSATRRGTDRLHASCEGWTPFASWICDLRGKRAAMFLLESNTRERFIMGSSSSSR